MRDVFFPHRNRHTGIYYNELTKPVLGVICCVSSLHPQIGRKTHVLLYSGTRQQRYANGQNLCFSAHTEHSAARFSLIASGCRSFTSPRDATEITRHRHLETSASTSFHEEKKPFFAATVPPCLHHNQEKKILKKKKKKGDFVNVCNPNKQRL